ncbi:amidohydrolase family protein [Arcticibacter tournemirensis]
MQRIDAHQHFWRFDPVRDSWITDDMSVIQRDFLPADLLPVLQAHQMDGCIAVQSDQSEDHNNFLLELAASNSFIKGIVGWVDLQSADIEKSLEYYRRHEKIKGFRHVLQGETDRALMLTPQFKRGIEALQKYGYSYDILIYPDQLQYATALAEAFPDQKFVLDHIAKPLIKDKLIEEWAGDIKRLALCPNVYCKASGMVTEADWYNWKYEDFVPYLDVVFEAFGSKRIMFGSDWPVCNVAGAYDKMIDIVHTYTSSLTHTEQELFWGGNAAEFYSLG